MATQQLPHRLDASGTTTDADAPPTSTDDVPPTQVYDQLVVQNPRICNNCFRRYKDVLEPPGDDYWTEHAYRTKNGWSSASLRQLVVPQTIRATTDGAVVNAQPSTTWRNEPECRARPAWVCEACGVIDGTAEMAVRETASFLSACERLFDRIREQDVGVDEEPLFATARAYKTDPQWSGRDFKIYGRAVAAGVRGEIDRPGV